MTPSDFLTSLEIVLQHRRVAFSRAAAIAFVESCGELIADNPDVDAWAGRFQQCGAIETLTSKGRQRQKGKRQS